MTGESCSCLLMLLTVVATCLGAAVPTQAQDATPNIVSVMVDNYGWGEPGVYGGGVLRGAPTPRIDRLASEGVRLLNFNVESQCVPSRSALLTGRHPIRSGTTKVVWGTLYGLVQWVLRRRPGRDRLSHQAAHGCRGPARHS